MASANYSSCNNNNNDNNGYVNLVKLSSTTTPPPPMEEKFVSGNSTTNDRSLVYHHDAPSSNTANAPSVVYQESTYYGEQQGGHNSDRQQQHQDYYTQQQQRHYHNQDHQYFHQQQQQHQQPQNYQQPQQSSHHPHYLHGSSAATEQATKRQKTSPSSFNAVVNNDVTAVANTVNAENSDNARKINSEQWGTMFERLKAYKEQFGDCLVPKRYAADPKLGTWVETQRVQYKKLAKEYDQYSGQEEVTPNKRLNQERLEKLRLIGFAWSAKNMRRSNSKAGMVGNDIDPITLNVSAGITTTTAATTASPATATEGNNTLTRGKPLSKRVTSVSSEEAAALRNRGRLNETQWNEMYDRLKEFKDQHGHCLVPRKYDADPKLGHWVETQRVLWNRDFRENERDGDRKTLPLDNGGSFTKQQVQDLQVFASQPYGSAVSPDQAGWPPHGTAATPLTAVTGSHFVHPEGGATAEDAAEIAETMSDLPNLLGAEGLVPASNAFASENRMALVDTYYDTSTQQAVDAIAEEVAAEAAKISAANPKRLTQERKDKLDMLGFVWSLRTKRIEDHWDQMFQQLLAYKQVHGDCLVPSRYEENLKLGKWVETQRYEYTKLQRAMSDTVNKDLVAEGEAIKNRIINPRLTEERRRRLEEAGFEWKVKHKMKRYYDKQWDQMFDRLLDFKAKNGHCMVPKRFTEDFKLGTWVHTQRIQYRKLVGGVKDGTSKEADYLSVAMGESYDAAMKSEEDASFRLTDERRKRLENIEFVWSVRESEKTSEEVRAVRNSYDDQWDMMFAKLCEYKGKYGDCLVPKRHKEDQRLGTWVDTQRVQYKKMKRSSFPQECNDDGSREGSEDSASDGINQEGAKAVSKTTIGRLTDDRIRRLEDLGFVWSLRDDWQKHYDELKVYKEKNGHCNVPARFPENRRLGIWVSAQRQQFKILQMPPDERPRRSAPLTRERIGLLNDLGFTWTIRSRDTLGESWTQRIEDLREYKAIHGHCLVPSRYPPNPELGTWVGTQRSQYRMFLKAKEEGQPAQYSISMNDERIKQLEDLGFVWTLRGDIIKKEVRPTYNNATIDRAILEVASVLADDPTHTITNKSFHFDDRADIETKLREYNV